MSILIIEDDKIIAEALQRALLDAGYQNDHSSEGPSALSLLQQKQYELIITDIMLPGLSGIELIQKIRSDGNKTPVLILSAKQSVDDRVEGLQAGGDDYLVKPFAISELLARTQALIRRSQSNRASAFLSYGDIVLDSLKREVVVGGKKLDLQAKEFVLLEFLLRNKGTIVSKTMILENIWNYNFDPQTNVVDVLVCRLRNKLDRYSSKKLIKTIRGVGYRLSDV